jgi:hypothetical protein
MPRKRSKSSKSSTRKKKPAAGRRLKRPPSSSPHHPYENRIYDAVNDILTDTQAIFAKLNNYDKNRSPTAGIITMVQDLMNEFDKGAPDEATHDSNIEQCLYAIAGIDDQYNIHGGTPDTDADKPSGDSHEQRVAELITTTNTITREVLNLLDSDADPDAPPDEDDYDTTEDFIVAIASDTRTIVALVRNDIHIFHGSGRYSVFSK